MRRYTFLKQVFLVILLCAYSSTNKASLVFCEADLAESKIQYRYVFVGKVIKIEKPFLYRLGIQEKYFVTFQIYQSWENIESDTVVFLALPFQKKWNYQNSKLGKWIFGSTSSSDIVDEMGMNFEIGKNYFVQEVNDTISGGFCSRTYDLDRLFGKADAIILKLGKPKIIFSDLPKNISMRLQRKNQNID